VHNQLFELFHCDFAGEWNCDYHDCVGQLQGFGSVNSESLAQLLLGFFQYWATQHDYKGQVLTIRSSCLMSKAVKGW
jgi:DNA polymerase sigma